MSHAGAQQRTFLSASSRDAYGNELCQQSFFTRILRRVPAGASLTLAYACLNTLGLREAMARHLVSPGSCTCTCTAGAQRARAHPNMLTRSAAGSSASYSRAGRPCRQQLSVAM
jgi:hypothetical protein